MVTSFGVATCCDKIEFVILKPIVLPALRPNFQICIGTLLTLQLESLVAVQSQCELSVFLTILEAIYSVSGTSELGLM